MISYEGGGWGLETTSKTHLWMRTVCNATKMSSAITKTHVLTEGEDIRIYVRTRDCTLTCVRIHTHMFTCLCIYAPLISLTYACVRMCTYKRTYKHSHTCGAYVCARACVPYAYVRTCSICTPTIVETTNAPPHERFTLTPEHLSHVENQNRPACWTMRM